jgi:two-component system chemotaxis response regulator CheB
MGASTGGVEAFRTICASLPKDFGAAVLLVLHVDAHPSILPRILSRSSALPVSHALHGEPVVAGRIYVAPPDHHMTIEDGRLMLVRGPKEHSARPAIDPLFRSAAAYSGARSLGVVLTGDLSDGTNGLLAIKDAGGHTIAQDPDDAAAPSMPAHALSSGAAQRTAGLTEIPSLITAWFEQLADVPIPSVPARDKSAEPSMPAVDFHTDANTLFTCPSCKGSLRRTGQIPYSFECYIGHKFALETLAHAQNQQTDEVLWSAYRALCEKSFLLQMLAEEAQRLGQQEQYALYRSRSLEASAMAATALELATQVPGTVANRE